MARAGLRRGLPLTLWAVRSQRSDNLPGRAPRRWTIGTRPAAGDRL